MSGGSVESPITSCELASLLIGRHAAHGAGDTTLRGELVARAADAVTTFTKTME
ncbi:hypothetical protein [Streptomyces sp. NPDC091383]|uniref:hypothetical protein n=1 Tax=Streptomyces sp. NPDC091383 TaxID=3365996 RepID=UPI00380A6328